MRDQEWLVNLFNSIWGKSFFDVEKKNGVLIRWKGRWKNKFGHIKRLKNGDTEIGINSLFKDELVPEYIIRLTVAHEIVHYFHGFQSPHPRMFQHPHKGGVVNKELRKRDFGMYITQERLWYKHEWLSLYKKLCVQK